MEKADTRYARLTPREREVLMLLAEGYSNYEIAQAIGLSYYTVKNHVSSIYAKLLESGAVAPSGNYRVEAANFWWHTREVEPHAGPR